MQQRTTTTTTTAATTSWYKSKHRRVAIYNGDNYPDWFRTAKGVLAVSRALLFVEGDREEEEGNVEDVKRVEAGMKILFNSVVPSFQTGIQEAIRNRNLV